jgi:hypothetical protein
MAMPIAALTPGIYTRLLRITDQMVMALLAVNCGTTTPQR